MVKRGPCAFWATRYVGTFLYISLNVIYKPCFNALWCYTYESEAGWGDDDERPRINGLIRSVFLNLLCSEEPLPRWNFLTAPLRINNIICQIPCWPIKLFFDVSNILVSNIIFLGYFPNKSESFEGWIYAGSSLKPRHLDLPQVDLCLKKFLSTYIKQKPV